MQYYWDLFDDLLAAYDELRWKGVDLMCACCPPEGLFPRHLMAGVLDPVTYDTADYRHRFVPSPAVGDCEDRTREVRLLFRRLVAMLESFTETPPDKGVRATPSRWGDVPVSAKAIPYYYDQDGTPPVFELWDPAKTARHRANQNLSYRADEYAPAAAAVRHRPAALRPRAEQLPADRGAPRQERPERARDAARAAEEPPPADRGDRAAHRGVRREHRRRPEQGGVPLPGPRDAVRGAQVRADLLPRQAGRVLLRAPGARSSSARRPRSRRSSC